MEETRASTPEAPPEDLWSSILDSVSTSRSIPSKQVVILGEPSSGKSSLAAALLNRTRPADEDKQEGHLDFALGYDWADVRDDADEDTLARLSVYVVPSSAPSCTALFPHFVPPRTCLPHTAFMIVLDWTRPWAFVEELETWLSWIEDWAAGDNSRELEVVREEGRERLQSYLQNYTEPSADPLPAGTSLSNTVLPLGPGTFTHNTSGVPIMVVCTKADLIDDTENMASANVMVKGKGGEWEERTDGVMQVLRTVCLKYGAALFYTTLDSETLRTVRQYALHMLFAPPASTSNAMGEATAPARNPFPFKHPPNTLDRDRIVVPAGWDSWGKIAVLREGFDAKAWGEAWERDFTEEGDEAPADGALTLFATLVPDASVKPPPPQAFNNPMPEQTFLAKHYDENAKKPDRDPRGAFRDPASATAGIVGPLGSSSFSLPTVERALSEMEAGGLAERNPLSSSIGPDGARKAGTASGARGAPIPVRAGSTTLAPGAPGSTRSSTPGASGSPPAGQTQHEVLHNFFQSLLTPRDRAIAAGARPPTANAGAGARTTNGGAEAEESEPA